MVFKSAFTSNYSQISSSPALGGKQSRLFVNLMKLFLLLTLWNKFFPALGEWVTFYLLEGGSLLSLEGHFPSFSSSCANGCQRADKCDKERAQCDAEVDVPTQVHGQRLEISSHMGHFWKP